jgi:hypothetical protein
MNATPATPTRTWLSPFVDAYEAKIGGIPYARLAKAVATARRAYSGSLADTLASFQFWVDNRRDVRFGAKTVERWAETAKEWTPAPPMFLVEGNVQRANPAYTEWERTTGRLFAESDR